MKIKTPTQPPVNNLQPASALSTRAGQTEQLIKNWQVGQLLRATVVEVTAQQARLDIQGITAYTATPVKPQLQAGSEILLQLVRTQPLPDFKILSVDTPVQQSVNTFLRNQLPQQQPLTQLLASLEQVLVSPKLKQFLPATILREIEKLVSSLPASHDIRQPGKMQHILKYSGLFTENNLLNTRHSPGKINPDQDIGVLLLRLVNLLKSNLRSTSATTQTPGQMIPGETLKDTLHKLFPDAQKRASPELNNLVNGEQLQREIIKNIESSLARLNSLKLFCLQNTDPDDPLWAFELPFLHQSSLDLFSIRIMRDNRKKQPAQTPPGWILLLAFDLPRLGTVHVRLGLLQEKISASFWFNQPGTHALFSEHLQTLQQQLKNSGLNVDNINLNLGEPSFEHFPSQKPILDTKA